MNDLANSPMTTTSAPKRIDFNTPELQRKRRIRAFKDHLTRWYVFIGGLAVLGAITLIFFFLGYVVYPLFQGADLNAKQAITPVWMQDAGKPLMISVEEQNQVGMRVSDKGQALFFTVDTGAELKRVDLALPAGASVVSIGEDQPGSPLVILGLSNGQSLVFRHTYKVSYPDGKKTISPEIEYPYGEAPMVLDEAGRILVQRRTPSKDFCPGMLDACAGGVVTTGEAMEPSARRELAEELGIFDVPLQDFGTFYAEGEASGGGYRVWGGLFICHYRGPLQLQAEEVSEVHWMSLAEIAERAAEFTPDSLLAIATWQARCLQ